MDTLKELVERRCDEFDRQVKEKFTEIFRLMNECLDILRGGGDEKDDNCF